MTQIINQDKADNNFKKTVTVADIDTNIDNIRATSMLLLSDDAVVRKSKVFSDILYYSNIPCLTFKLIDIYLSVINPLKVETSNVVFFKRDIANILGGWRISDKELDSAFNVLLNTMELRDIDFPDNTTTVSCLFITIRKDVKKNLYELIPSEDGIRYFFDLGKKHPYYKYRVNRITGLKDETYKFMQLILSDIWQYKKVVTIPTDELKKYLQSQYDTLYRIKIRKLIPILIEMQEKAKIPVGYRTERIKHWKSIDVFLFTLEKPLPEWK